MSQTRAARVAITAVFAVSGAAFGTWRPRIPAVQDRLDLGAGRLGIALAGVAAGALVAMPVAGREASRHGSAPVVRVLLAALVLALPLPFLAPSLGLLVVAASSSAPPTAASTSS